MKTISIADRRNPNLEYEVDIEAPPPPLPKKDHHHYFNFGGGSNKPRLIGMKGAGNDKDKGESFDDVAPPRTDEEIQQQRQRWSDNQEVLREFPKLYEFLGKLAFALSIGVDSLLRITGKPWHNQWVLNLDVSSYKSDSDGRFEAFFRAVASQDVYGGVHGVYEELALSARNITLREVIESSVTSAAFARLVAASMRHGAGGSAQAGRMYASVGGSANGGGAIVNRVAYNVHAGYKHRQHNEFEIGKEKVWFSGIRKTKDGGGLAYSEPDIISEWRQKQKINSFLY